jgi:peptide deformylase
MKLPIYAYGHPVLRKKCEAVEQNLPELNAFIEDMWETMYHTRGIGLAAPQVGKALRIFVADTEQLNDDEDDKENFIGIKKVFINPVKVKEAGEPWNYEEGCLSIPEIRGKVSRPPQIRLTYFDENFVQHDDVFDGMNARVIQHEYDHIEGFLFTDHLSALKKQLIKTKLEKIRKGEIKPKYKMVFGPK